MVRIAEQRRFLAAARRHLVVGIDRYVAVLAGVAVAAELSPGWLAVSVGHRLDPQFEHLPEQEAAPPLIDDRGAIHRPHHVQETALFAPVREAQAGGHPHVVQRKLAGLDAGYGVFRPAEGRREGAEDAPEQQET